MNEKKIKLVGKINELPSKTIFINVTHLEKGNYELNIVYNNKLISKSNFIKK
jgi:hypothetical protein